ncbi:MAG: hypothetical protein KDD55_05690 [Bdellovibrionales bacterium]|nr:hypothetical protein [Bdellovibrionales bacterium]
MCPASGGELLIYCFALWTLQCHLGILLEVSLSTILSSYLVLLFLGLIWFSQSLLIHFKQGRRGHSLFQSISDRLIFIVSSLGCAVLSLAVHRPDLDDCFHLSTALVGKLHPHLPPGTPPNFMYGAPEGYWLPIPWRFQTLESFYGAFAYLFDVSPMVIAHLVVPPIAAIVTVYSFARLYRTVCPKYEQWLLLATVLFFLASGDSNVSYGNFGGFVRLHQGKGIFFTAIIPLLLSVSYEFVKLPSLRLFLLLVLTQVASVGLTSSAIVIAPSVVLIAILSSAYALKSDWKSVCSGLLTSVYPVFLGIVLLLCFPDGSGAEIDMEKSIPRSELLTLSILTVFSNSALGILSIFFIVFSCVLAPMKRLRLLCVGIVTLSVVFFLNPISIDFLTPDIIPALVYYRMVWILHVPLLFSIGMLTVLLLFDGKRVFYAKVSLLFTLTFLLISLIIRFSSKENSEPLFLGLLFPYIVVFLLLFVLSLYQARRESRPLIQGVGFSVFSVIVFLGAPSMPVLSPQNATYTGVLELDWPRFKVVQEDYRLAKRMHQLAPEGTAVLAPYIVSGWFSTIDDRALPLIARNDHIPSARKFLTTEDLGLRIQLIRVVSGQSVQKEPAILLTEGMKQYPLSVLCFEKSSLDKNVLSVLRSARYMKQAESSRYEVWAVPIDLKDVNGSESQEL